jgi:hypothetical protein
MNGLFNGQGYHSVAETLGVLSNVVMRASANNLTIRTSNFPLPRSPVRSFLFFVFFRTRSVFSFINVPVCFLLSVLPLSSSALISLISLTHSHSH